MFIATVSTDSLKLSGGQPVVPELVDPAEQVGRGRVASAGGGRDEHERTEDVCAVDQARSRQGQRRGHRVSGHAVPSRRVGTLVRR
jgi:hypothetical protein